jgi:hypothetical protein
VVSTLEDMVGLGESRRHVAEPDPAAVVSLVGEVVPAVVLVDHRGTLGQRLLDVEHRRQILVLDRDRRGARVGRGLRLGHDRADRLTEVADLALGQDRLVVRGDPDQLQRRVEVVRNVLVGQHLHHSGHRERAGQVH